MSYTIDDMEKDINSIMGELAVLRKAKGHDYSGTADTLDNLREFGSFGVVVRIGDKFKRLKHFYSQKELAVHDEKIEDTMQDLINYACYLLIMYRQERGPTGAGEDCVPSNCVSDTRPIKHNPTSQNCQCRHCWDTTKRLRG
jgi:hypothetical protein